MPDVPLFYFISEKLTWLALQKYSYADLNKVYCQSLTEFLVPCTILKTQRGWKLRRNKKKYVVNIAADSDVYDQVTGERGKYTLTKRSTNFPKI